MSRNRSTPKISAIPTPLFCGSTPSAARTAAIIGSVPPGTPAVPRLAMSAQPATKACWEKLRSTPAACARKITVTPSYSAVPFWLVLAPAVSTNRETSGRSSSGPSAARSDTGNVALLEAVAKAVETGSRIPRQNLPRSYLAKNFSTSGYTPNACSPNASNTVKTKVPR